MDCYGIRIEKTSAVYESDPFGGKTGMAFLNACVRVRTELKPLQLIFLLKRIERLNGRADFYLEKERFSSRTLDIDILYSKDFEVDTEFLKIPHSSLFERDFFLIPLLDVVDAKDTELKSRIEHALLSLEKEKSLIIRKVRNAL